MPYPGLTFYRSELDHTILKELDEHNAALNGFLAKSHRADGSNILPPFLALTNVENPWSAPQTFPGLTITPNTFTVGGSVVTVNGPVTLPQTLTLPPNIAYLDASQEFTGTNVFGNTNLVFRTAGVNGYLRVGSLANLTGEHFLLINTQDVNPYTQIHFAGAETTLGDWFNQNVKTTGTPTFAGLSFLTPTGDGTFFGTTTAGSGASSNVNFVAGAGAPTRLYLRASDGLVVAPSVAGVYLVGPGYFGQGGPAFIYVGPYRVDVTANCSIPGTGGGATLPPNMAFTNIDNLFSAYQNFNAGLAFNGHDLGSWLNQSVKTDASPTFTALTLNNGTDVCINATGRIQAGTTIEAGNAFMAQGQFGLTITQVIGGVTMKFVGGIRV